MSTEAVRYILAQNIKPAALKFYMERVAYRVDNDKGYAWPSQELIASEMSVSRNTVRKYQEECEHRGILIPRASVAGANGRFRNNNYEIPGFMEWLKRSDDDARIYFVPQKPCPPGGAMDTVHTPRCHGPCTPRGAMDRGNPEVPLKEKGKEKVIDSPYPLKGDEAQASLCEEGSPTGKAPNGAKTAKRVTRQRQAATYTANYERAWALFPEREGMSKLKGFQSWQNENCEPIAEQVIHGIKRYAELRRVESTKRDPGKVKHIRGWLSDKRWESFQTVTAAPDAEDLRRRQLAALTLDLMNRALNGALDRAKKYWQRIEDVPADLLAEARRKADERLQFAAAA